MALLLTADGSGLQRVGRGLSFVGAAGPPTPTDPYINNVSLLLHGEGEDGGTTITDSSPYALTVTSTNTTTSTTRFKFGSSSIAFNGTSSCLALQSDIGLQFGAGNFTIEFFAYFNAISDQLLYDTIPLGGNGARNNGFAFVLKSNGKLDVFSGGSFRGESAQSVQSGQWTHIALVRSGNTFTYWINAINSGTFALSTNFSDASGLIGRVGDGAAYWVNGYLDEYRISKGVARTITVPDAAYPNPVDIGLSVYTRYIAAVELADGQLLETGVKTAIGNFINGCISDGNWQAIKASCILAGARSLAGALVPLKGNIPTNSNFVNGDYNRKTGLTGNGNTKYLLANRLSSLEPQNSFHLAINRTAGTADLQCGIGNDLAYQSGSNYIAFSTNTYFRSRTNGEVFISGNTTGFIGHSRSNSSQITARASSASTVFSLASQTPRSTNIGVYAGWDGTHYSSQTLSFYSIGEAVDLALLDARITTLMADLAAAIP